MNHQIRILSVAVALACAAFSVNAQSTRFTEKDGYTLFNPTPRSLMREMSTDRPDTTESPYTVDAGHVQFELSFVDYGRNDDDDHGPRTDTVSTLPSNVKLGLTNNIDVQFVFTPYEYHDTEGHAGDDTRDGFSDDTQIRVKFNLWGNDGPDQTFGDTAFAIMPFVKIPTGTAGLSNHRVEGGLILPLSTGLPGNWDLGVMAEFDLVYNDVDDDYGVDFVHTATISHDVPGVENLGFYVEYVGIAPHNTGATYEAIASGGLTYQMNENWILDCGGTAGISESADDFTVFVGTSFRF